MKGARFPDPAPPRAVLAVDAAGPVVGAAVWRAGSPEPAHVFEERIVRGADARLVPAIAAMLPDDLDLVAVTVGPGAFNGLRVGLAAALGVAVARGVSVAPASSLLARAALVEAPRVLAVLDARKGRLYGGWFAGGPNPRPLGPELDAEPEAVLAADPGEGAFVAVGEGTRLLAEAVARAGGAVAERPDRSPAPALARLALAGLLEPVDPARVGLRYLRPGVRPRPEPEEAKR